MDLLMPGRFTSEGAEQWFAEREALTDERGNFIAYGDYVREPFCTIITDEISQSFKEAKKEHMTGSMELISQLYDGELKGTALAGGSRIPQSPIYVSLLGATVPEFVPSIPDFVFEQGMAGRIYWLYIEPAENLPELEIMDWRRAYNAKKSLAKYSAILRRLLDLNISQEHNPNRERIHIRIGSDASKLYNKYNKSKYREWFIDGQSKPSDYDWQYKRRLHELVLKKAGLFAVGRHIDFLETINSFKSIRVNKSDMKKAVLWVNNSEKHLKKIIKAKKLGAVYSMGAMKAKNEVYSSWNLVDKLLRAKNRMLNTKQLRDASGISDNTTFTKYLKSASKRNLIRLVDKKNEIKDDAELERLGLGPNRNYNIWTVTDEVFK